MEPILTGLTTKLLYDVLARGVSVARADSVADRVTQAAETVAAEHSELKSEDLVDALTDDTVGECVERFERGEPLRVTEIAEAFREQAAAKHVDAGFGADTETVVREFVRELQRELAHEPAVWRAMALREIKQGTHDTARLTAAVEELGERLDDATVVDVDALATAVEQTRAQGFEWVTAHDFETGRVNDDYCWRRSFTLGEAWAGYPLERERPLADGGRQDLTDQLLDTLADGGGAALLGAPGSGKTTATRTAMAEWIRRHDGGTVFYRRKGVQTPVDHEQLREEIETARENGPVLVAVEDAARRGSYPVFETAADFEAADDVSFLVNARKNEWRDSDEGMRDSFGDLSQASADVRRAQSECFELVDVPPFDAREVERFVENYETVTGRAASLGDDSDAILSQIRGHAGISPMLLLAYHVPVWTDEIDARTDTDVPALVENVREVFRFAHGGAEGMPLDTESPDETALVAKLALAVNVLNAAELGVRREYLLGFGEELEEVVRIDELLSQLQGPLLFGREEQRYRTHHPLWSRLYLSEHLERASSPAKARLEFGRCVNEVFTLLDSAERRAVVSEFLGETELLESMEDSPERLADELILGVFSVGEDRPELTPLFGTSNSTQIDLPDVCSSAAAVWVAFSRSGMYGKHGDRDRQMKEIEEARKRHEAIGLDSNALSAEYHLRLGNHALGRGEFEDARSHFERAQEEAPSSGDGASEAIILNNLGSVAQSLGEYERAWECFSESLNIAQEIGDQEGVARSLNNLGMVADSLGEYEQAQECLKESLNIAREIGDREGEANSLTNLGIVTCSLGEYERAREWLKESLNIAQEIGYRSGEAKSLGNLGLVADSLGEYEQARERYHESLAIEREIGDRGGEADSLINLGVVARNLGEYEQARERLRESLAIAREIGDRRAEANSLNNLGNLEAVQAEQENYRAAIENYSDAADVFRDIGAVRSVLKALTGLSRAAAEIGETETALDACREALDLIEQSDLDGLDDRAREFRVRDARLDESPEGTLELYYHALGHVLENEAATAFRLFRETWERRDIHDDDTEASAFALAAGVGFAAHLELFDSEPDETDDDGLPTDPDDVLAEIDPAAAARSDAVRAVYDHLAGDEPAHTPDELDARVDRHVGDDRAALGTLVFARLLRALAG